VPTALRVTYDMGKENARILLEEWAGDAAVGNWRCRPLRPDKGTYDQPGCVKHADCLWQTAWTFSITAEANWTGYSRDDGLHVVQLIDQAADHVLPEAAQSTAPLQSKHCTQLMKTGYFVFRLDCWP
jgi:hypothetical protein